MDSANKLHNIKEWEESIKNLPISVELRECTLKGGKVMSFTGAANVYGRERLLKWDPFGECTVGRNRAKEFDITFNHAMQ